MKIVRKRAANRIKFYCPMCCMYDEKSKNCMADSIRHKFPNDDDRCWDDNGGRFYFVYQELSSNTIVI